MALRDVLVKLDHNKDGLARLKLAAELASRHEARLTGLYVQDESAHQQAIKRAGEMGLISAGIMNAATAGIAMTVENRMDETRKHFDQELRNSKLHGEWRCHKGGLSR
jgi:K+-sensing histidine kinase KdpD